MNPDLDAIVRSMTEIIPSQCGCRGNGWMHTDYDTMHECPLHYCGQPNNEDEMTDEDRAAFPWEKLRLQLDRKAYIRLRAGAVADLVAMGIDDKRAHKLFAKRVAQSIPHNPTAEDWLNHAQDAAWDAHHMNSHPRSNWITTAMLEDRFMERDG
jgi:hypothetical protein